MVTVVKSEWHQVEKRYSYDIDQDVLSEIYPDLDERQIGLMLLELTTGDKDISEVLDEAWNQGVDIDWEWLDEDDWWTDRKGGYEVTYEVQGE
jgi:hypothetical protein